MMTKFRGLWFLIDTNGIKIRPRHIRAALNMWATT
jgi:hypothetical protein